MPDRRHRYARSGDRRRRTPATPSDRAVRRRPPRAPPASPASRSARLMWIGRSTGVMPYSDRTTTRRPLRAPRRQDRRRPRRSRPAIAEPRDELVRTEALQVVVEMRQIDERQRRIVLGHDQLGGFGNPARRGDRGGRPPELKQRKRTEPLGQPLAQFGRHGVAIGQLAPVGLVDRPRRRAEIVARRHVVPPEHVGAGEARDRAACRPPRSSRRRPAGWIAARASLPSGRGTASRCRRCRARAAAVPVMKRGLDAAGDGRRDGLQAAPWRLRGQAPKAAASADPRWRGVSPTTIIASTGFKSFPRIKTTYGCRLCRRLSSQFFRTLQTGLPTVQAKWHPVAVSNLRRQAHIARGYRSA